LPSPTRPTKAGFTTLFLLGQWDVLREEKWILPETSEGRVETIMLDIRAQGEAARVAPTAMINAGDRSSLTCRVIGAELVFDAVSKMSSISIAEALLGVVESFVATSLNAKVLPACERLLIRIDPVPTHVGPPVLVDLLRKSGEAFSDQAARQWIGGCDFTSAHWSGKVRIYR